jgi:hypothetical protein
LLRALAGATLWLDLQAAMEEIAIMRRMCSTMLIEQTGVYPMVTLQGHTTINTLSWGLGVPGDRELAIVRLHKERALRLQRGPSDIFDI